MDYEAWEKKVETTMQPYLDLFERDLEKSQLTQKTIRRHVENMQLFLVDYTVRYVNEPDDEDEKTLLMNALGKVSDFVGYFFIHKCLWSTPSSVKGLCATIKKFCNCMVDNGIMTSAQYREMFKYWKDYVEDWVEECRAYNGASGSYWF